MKIIRLSLFALFSLVTQIGHSQNLVLNPSFEIANGCPNQINQVDKADGWSGYGGTPDYFNACSNVTSPLYGVPTNTRGFQAARTGNAYIGLFTYANFGPNLREFVGRPLAAPLQPGTTYFVSMWVTHVEQSLVQFATNNIGVRFSTVPFSQANPDTVNNMPVMFATSIITDSINWVNVSGSFVADSAYTHICIGNYFSDTLTSIINMGSPTTVYAYYLIDDVCVSPDPVFCPVEITSISETRDQKLSVFPNPANKSITISTARMQNISLGEIQIYNETGQLKYSRKSGSEMQLTIDISAWSGGCYFVKLISEDAISNMRFVVVE
ncbi:MAG: T9SS type A sorting domain-containing protein [Bacteroidia bacterium]|nr:T9SS type A sorting domain-containing protein [Bacteroidota bacterium]MBP9083899.1 T9SS type A sorting domain-containing protein [Bacteroidia bacterium]MBK7388933.1 T9SS type A sorting domain-containing protein [Bacteroidota bacterium]MBK7968245.1 T9SS type A sorting domain-containing protein [Bacteroidota bacterium]MBK8873278.1 T9SS type A sorting domain-containing protein [Bacteroidota bacterium]